ncbi:MAG: divalent-cation tolerance protein CutA [Nevskia sp.]|nr:divalent-cation tolerance protein CutA [Nevskia sp.]
MVFVTCPAEAAATLAEALVQRRLAACVNSLAGVNSVYRWREAVERGSETLLLIKTSRARYPALEAAVRELHPYELPEILAVHVAAGLPAYLQWIQQSTA